MWNRAGLFAKSNVLGVFVYFYLPIFGSCFFANDRRAEGKRVESRLRCPGGLIETPTF